jgi:putative pyoverdin transport system ATP-binding/permease protein
MMLYQLVRQESEGAKARIILAAICSALANTSVLAIISTGLHARGHLHVGLWILFVVICVGYAVSYRYCVTTITRLVEAALYKVRLRLGEKLRRADLITIEQIGTPQIYDQIVQQTTLISNSSWLIALGLQAFVFLVILLCYVFYLSRILFFLFILLSLLAAPLYHGRSQKVAASLQQVSRQRVSLYSLLTDFLRGVKETRLRTRRGDELYAHFDQAAATLKEDTVQLHVLDQENINFMHFNMYVLLATTVFILPQLSTTSTQSLSELSAAALFLTGPIGILAFTIPEYERAELAATGIQALEDRLDQAERAAPQEAHDPFDGRFSALEADQLCFSYAEPNGGEGFSLGPISLSLRAGEIVFIVGGNGSGKTTLLKLLTGLYAPTSGSLRVDQHLVEAANLQAYRELIAAVFTDFYLFKKLYGLSDRTAEQVRGLLQQLELTRKTAYGAEGFTNLELSTGQRKRLAMVVALLEDRPLYVFDEWAADQDPEFRRYYYEELLPELKRRGKTVLAISHDDRYFHCADRVVFMEYGAIRSIESIDFREGET